MPLLVGVTDSSPDIFSGPSFLYQVIFGVGIPLGGSQCNSAFEPSSTRNEVGVVENCLRITAK